MDIYLINYITTKKTLQNFFCYIVYHFSEILKVGFICHFALFFENPRKVQNDLV